MPDERMPRQRLRGWSIPRLGAAAGAVGALGYGIWMVSTALVLSEGASLGWRAQLLLLEGGIPLLFTLGFGLAAWGSPRLRRLGWALVGIILLGSFLWVWHMLTPHPIATGSVVLGPPLLLATLDPDSRNRLIEQLYRQYARPLVAFGCHACARAGLDESLAEDVVHDLFTACSDPEGAHDAALQRAPHRVKGWLYKMVRQQLSTRWRSEQRLDDREAEAAWDALVLAPSPAEVYDDVECQAVIDTVLEHAPPRSVQAWRLVREEGLTYADAGEVMGITAGAVGAHLTAITRLLRPELADWWAAGQEATV